MLPSWIRSRNCRPRFVYFFAMENNEAQIGLDHFLLGTARLGLADGYLAVDFLDVVDREVIQALEALQLLLSALDLVFELAEGRGILLPALHVLREPAGTRFVLRERRDENPCAALPASRTEMTMISFLRAAAPQ